MALEQETTHYLAIKDELLEHHEGKYALIIGEELIGTYDSDGAAYAAGIEAKGNVPMLIVKVSKDDDEKFNVPALFLGLLDADLQL